MIKKILLTGASGWFGQSFVSEFIDFYGLKKLEHLILVTSDGRSITHPRVSYPLKTITMSEALGLSGIGVIVQAAFLTRDKIEKFGPKQYQIESEILLNNFKKILLKNSNARVYLISSGAIYKDPSLYGEYKRIEEKISENYACRDLIIFRVFMATTRYMQYRDWSSICYFLKQRKEGSDIVIRGMNHHLRSLVCLEDLSKFILLQEAFASPTGGLVNIFDAVSDSATIVDLAQYVSSGLVPVTLPDGFDHSSMNYEYSSNKEDFILRSLDFNMELKNVKSQVKNCIDGFYINYY